MSNKVTTAMDNLEAALAALIDAGTLRAVERRVIGAGAEPRPMAAVVLTRLAREDTTWTAELLLQLAAASGRDADEAIVELVADVDAALTAFIDGGSAGAAFDRPAFEIWYARTNDGLFARVGAMAALRLRVQDPLSTDS